jgi:hypothetical protein
MTGMRSHTDHQSRLDWWHRQLQRQSKTNLTIADFCRQLGVSIPTFYYWKRRVHKGPDTPFGRIPMDHPSPHPTALAAAANHFVPVSIVNPDAGTHLEIELANACVVRLRGSPSHRFTPGAAAR